MTPDEFTALASGCCPNVQSRPIFETVQFRLGGKAFATVGWPAAGWAVVKVAPSQQAWALSLSAGVAPESGRRRRAGIVLVRLAAINALEAAELLAAAWSFAGGAMARRGGVGSGTAVAGLSA